MGVPHTINNGQDGTTPVFVVAGVVGVWNQMRYIKQVLWWPDSALEVTLLGHVSSSD